MKKKLREIAEFLGLLHYIHFFREKYFPTRYYLNSQKDAVRYVKFYSEFIKPNDLCFDVGAHRGHRTEIFLKLKARVVAIEPQKMLSRYLKLKYAKRVFVENVGLGDSSQEKTMYISDSSSLSTFSAEWLNKAKDRFSDVKWDKKQKVQITTLDKMIDKYGVPIFCKIDVEGFEYEVLKGLSKPITYISLEFMTPENCDIVRDSLFHLNKLCPEIEINYSIGDTLKLSLEKWLNFNDAIELFSETLFKQATWGDIYVKMM